MSASHAKREVRGVSGWGPRCGCGGKSVVHLRAAREVAPETSTFLCRECIGKAVDIFLTAFPQPPYWPGDEGRDESYEAPAYERGAREDLHGGRGR